MTNFIKNNYLFLVLFLLLLFKEPIYELFTIKEDEYNLTKCKITEDDYNKLLEFNEIDYIYDSKYLNSYVIYKDIYNYLEEITIRGGKDHGLKNEPVIYDNTLVGVINKVYDNSSIVKLITNKDSKISVKINEEIGILEYEGNKLVVNNLSNYSNFSLGDAIYTSGLGNIKENIFIGYIKDIILDSKGIEKKVVVDYNLDIKNIDYVTIMKEDK